MYHKTNSTLIDEVIDDELTTELERALAERLFGAICELDRLTKELDVLRAANDGIYSRIEG